MLCLLSSLLPFPCLLSSLPGQVLMALWGLVCTFFLYFLTSFPFILFGFACSPCLHACTETFHSSLACALPVPACTYFTYLPYTMHILACLLQKTHYYQTPSVLLACTTILGLPPVPTNSLGDFPAFYQCLLWVLLMCLLPFPLHFILGD